MKNKFYNKPKNYINLKFKKSTKKKSTKTHEVNK